MSEAKDNKNKRIGWITSVVVQLVLLLVFYFLIAWREPFPPIPTYGIELNFGLEQSGRGAEPAQSIQQPEPTETETEEAEIEEVVEETEIPEVVEEVIEETAEPETEAIETFEDINSPDVVEETVEAEIPAEPAEEVSPVPDSKPEPKEEVKPIPEPETPKINNEALMPGSTEGKDQQNTSQGTSDGTGDEGKKEGTVDGRAIYGSQGSANGASLNMAGWTWDFKPEPQDNSNEEGKIVYKIVIDEDGYLSRIDLVSSTVSPEIERVYRVSVERLSFSQTNDYQPAPTSTGYVTFIIKTK